MPVKITGEAALYANLRRVAKIPRNAELDSAMREALMPMVADINARAPRKILKGTARSALYQAYSATRRVWWIAFREPGRRVAHLIELGTAPHSLAKGASRRHGIMQDVPPHHPGTPQVPFVRPAFESQKATVVSALGRAIWARITIGLGRG
jgi:hypothetical protein